jgi:hypothetical protein
MGPGADEGIIILSKFGQLCQSYAGAEPSRAMGERELGSRRNRFIHFCPSRAEHEPSKHEECQAVASRITSRLA